jgi:hypothetical protein
VRRPNYRLELTARLYLAERPQLNRSVGQTLELNRGEILKESEIKIIKEIFGLHEIDDPELIRLEVQRRFESMNAIEKADYKMRIGIKLQEAEAMIPGEVFSPPTWTLCITSIFFIVLSAIATFLIFNSNIWSILKGVIGILGIIWILMAWRSAARVIYRLVNKRDW